MDKIITNINLNQGNIYIEKLTLNGIELNNLSFTIPHLTINPKEISLTYIKENLEITSLKGELSVTDKWFTDFVKKNIKDKNISIKNLNIKFIKERFQIDGNFKRLIPFSIYLKLDIENNKLRIKIEEIALLQMIPLTPILSRWKEQLQKALLEKINLPKLEKKKDYFLIDLLAFSPLKLNTQLRYIHLKDGFLTINFSP